MMKVELLAPAGDLEKVKFALLYGADAVYIGGQEFSLRARASKFSLEAIKEAVEFAHSINKKIYVTTNIVFHNDDVDMLDDYLLSLDKMKVDAIICSSPVIIDRAKSLTNLEIHLSTQVSVTNSSLTNFWADQGIKRVVLARECSIDEIREIKRKARADLEVFIHGGMCVSYSGKCTLSNYMTDRDANRGGCAHSCRWKYNLYDDHHLVSEDYDFQMSSKDLETLRYIKDLMDIGVASLKIEGRMKSIHYIATVVNAYREFIDDYEADALKDISYYEAEIRKAENRLTSYGFMEGITSVKQQLYNMRSEVPTKEFVGIVLSYDDELKEAIIEQRNYFQPGDKLEIFSPKKPTETFTSGPIFDEGGLELDAARHPLQKIKIHCETQLSPYDILRKVF
ncbi:MAG: U32 family peptidase [Firmicutes bacterium]|nr:U32 family peptidase [Bacillota bacterium]